MCSSSLGKSKRKATSAGQFVSARLVVKDQIDDEIYFPTIKLKNDVNGEIDEKVAAFRESVNIPGLKQKFKKLRVQSIKPAKFFEYSRF